MVRIFMADVSGRWSFYPGVVPLRAHQVGIAPGQQFEIHKQANGALTLQAKSSEGLDAFAGCLSAPPNALSLDEMNDMIAKYWAGQP